MTERKNDKREITHRSFQLNILLVVNQTFVAPTYWGDVSVSCCSLYELAKVVDGVIVFSKCDLVAFISIRIQL